MVLAVLNTEGELAVPQEGEISRVDTPTSKGDEPVFHQAVMIRETLDHFLVKPDGVYVDATVGEGGHSAAILRVLESQGRVLGIDRDPRSLARADQRLEQYGGRFTAVQGNYADMVALASDHGITQADGVLLDLGLSSRHLEAPGYGFSFQVDEPLDMRYDPASPVTAQTIVNTYREEELAQVLFQYGEEPRSRAIARAVVRNRPVRTTGELAQVVTRALGGRSRRRIHPATRTFQALRIAVNNELEILETGLEQAIRLLARQGRLVVISYHSLEDRIVKTILARESAGCICPPEVLVCICDHVPTVNLVNRRVIKPSLHEVEVNSRSRSARMRVAQRRPA